MTINVRRTAGTPLTDEDRVQLQALSRMPDAEIDFSDIPEHAPVTSALPLEEHTVTLRIDAEVAAWLDSVSPEDASHINFVLKRAAQRSKNSTHHTASLLDKAS